MVYFTDLDRSFSLDFDLPHCYSTYLRIYTDDESDDDGEIMLIKSSKSKSNASKDDAHKDDKTQQTVPEPASKLSGIVVETCPNRANPYHECSAYCQERYGKDGSKDGGKDIKDDENDKDVIVVPTCPNRTNPFHECSAYCQGRYGDVKDVKDESVETGNTAPTETEILDTKLSIMEERAESIEKKLTELLEIVSYIYPKVFAKEYGYELLTMEDEDDDVPELMDDDVPELMEDNNAEDNDDPPPLESCDERPEKDYLDAPCKGLDLKQSVRFRCDHDMFHKLRGCGELKKGDRILLVNSVLGDNSICVYNGISLEHSDDFKIGTHAAGAFVFVEEGEHANTGWVVTNEEGKDVIGRDKIVFLQFNGHTSLLHLLVRHLRT